MRRSRMLLFVVTLVAAAVGGYATAFAQPTTTTQKVTVTMTEFKFKLSKTKINTGTVVFTVVNRGKIAHDFKINGKKTPQIKPGHKATLKVVFKKKGTYAYICTLPGHASAGMKGRLGVGVKPTPPPITTTTTTVAATCASPQTTTVNVEEFEYGYTLTPASPLACGTVTFNQSNTGTISHNFQIQDVPGATGAIIDPGKTTTFTVTLAPGTYTYLCNVSGHAQAGMIGTFKVSG